MDNWKKYTTNRWIVLEGGITKAVQRTKKGATKYMKKGRIIRRLTKKDFLK
jgi:hypothetical protein